LTPWNYRSTQMLTIEELMEKMLTEYESEDIIFTLKIEAEELLERFSDRVEEMQDELREEFDDECIG
jgi:broad specificity phosphatase PhoE